MPSVRCLVAEDHPALLRAVADFLERSEITVAATAADGESAVAHDQIGARLSISADTVLAHVRKASIRLGASTRTEAVATALRRGLIR